MVYRTYIRSTCRKQILRISLELYLIKIDLIYPSVSYISLACRGECFEESEIMVRPDELGCQYDNSQYDKRGWKTEFLCKSLKGRWNSRRSSKSKFSGAEVLASTYVAISLLPPHRILIFFKNLATQSGSLATVFPNMHFQQR